MGRFLAGRAYRIATRCLYPKLGLTAFAGIEVSDQIALCRYPIMFEVSAATFWTGDVFGIDKRVTRGLFVATHNGVGV